jgi:hypothetical protein
VASIRTWEYRDSMALETCPAMLMITSVRRQLEMSADDN